MIVMRVRCAPKLLYFNCDDGFVIIDEQHLVLVPLFQMRRMLSKIAQGWMNQYELSSKNVKRFVCNILMARSASRPSITQEILISLAPDPRLT